MKKSFKVTWTYFLEESFSGVRVFSFTLSFIWTLGYYLKFYSENKAKEVLMDTVAIVIIPVLVASFITYIYHFLRSDLYIEKDKSTLTNSLVTGNLVYLVEHYTPEGVGGLGDNKFIRSVRKLKQYRKSYANTGLHQDIDKFLGYFTYQDNLFAPSVKVRCTSKQEAVSIFPVVKDLGNSISSRL